jgi:hypothetical protein
MNSQMADRWHCPARGLQFMNGLGFCMVQRFEWVSMLCMASRKGGRKDMLPQGRQIVTDRAGVVCELSGYAIVLQD